jgi:hypothetical protein
MHGFYAMGAVLHTIIVAVVAFFVLFAASKAAGFVKLLGFVLGWILLIGAAASLFIGIYFIVTGHHPPWMEGEHAGWMREHDSGAVTPGAAQQVPQTPPAPSH